MINGKTFVISSRSLPEDEWSAIRMKNGMFLNWNSGLDISFSGDNDHILIGSCWSAKPDEDPADVIRQSACRPAGELLELEKYWCGRYILILNSTIYTDPAGLLCVFYTEDMISNSLDLLREYKGLKTEKVKLRYGSVPDFVPGTETPYEGITRLLPSQAYDFASKQTYTRKLLPDSPLTFADEAERINTFIESFGCSLKNMDRYYAGYTKLLACTGGRDSRATFAVMDRAGLPFDLFLLGHDSIAEADVRISLELSKAFNKKHYFIKRDPRSLSKDRLREFDRHTTGYVIDQDRMFYACGQYEALKNAAGGRIAVIRSALWETPVEFYGLSSINRIKNRFRMFKYDKSFGSSLDKWMRFVKDDSLNTDLSDGNRFYWDMRAGCWLSSIERSFDLYDGIVSVQPLNCRYLLALLMGFREEDRLRKLHEEKITLTACPAMQDIPYDYQLSKGGVLSKKARIRNRLSEMKWLLFSYGPADLIDFYRNREK